METWQLKTSNSQATKKTTSTTIHTDNQTSEPEANKTIQSHLLQFQSISFFNGIWIFLRTHPLSNHKDRCSAREAGMTTKFSSPRPPWCISHQTQHPEAFHPRGHTHGPSQEQQHGDTWVSLPLTHALLGPNSHHTHLCAQTRRSIRHKSPHPSMQASVSH